jgi:hypothetical protein
MQPSTPSPQVGRRAVLCCAALYSAVPWCAVVCCAWVSGSSACQCPCVHVGVAPCSHSRAQAEEVVASNKRRVI